MTQKYNLTFVGCTRVVLVALFALSILSSEFANAQKKKRRKSSYQSGVVKNNGSAVYKARAFDAPVVGYLQAGQKVRVSRRIYTGLGEFGLFYRVIAGKKLRGYVADTDIIPQFKSSAKKGGDKVENPVFDEAITPREEPDEPLYFTKFIGFTFGSINYTEIFSGRKLSSATPFYGLKMTGPSSLVGGAPLNIDLMFALTPPSYYDAQIATQNTSGFISQGSAALKIPLVDMPNALIFYSIGLMYSFTNIDLVINNQAFDSQEFKLGAVLEAGAATRLWRKYLIQGEIKYYYETTQYLGFFGSLNFKY